MCSCTPRDVTLEGVIESVLLFNVDNRHCDASEQRIEREVVYGRDVRRDELCEAVLDKLGVERPNNRPPSQTIMFTDVDVDVDAARLCQQLTASVVNRQQEALSSKEKLNTALTVGKDSHVKAYLHRFTCPGVTIVSPWLTIMHVDAELAPPASQPVKLTFTVRLERPNTLPPAVPLPPGKYGLLSRHGTWLRGCPNAVVNLAPKRDSWEVWTLMHVGGVKVALASSHGLVLRGRSGGAGAKVDLHDRMVSHWRLVLAGTGWFGLLSEHGLLLRAHPGGDGAYVDQQANLQDWEVQTWEQWKLQPV